MDTILGIVIIFEKHAAGSRWRRGLISADNAKPGWDFFREGWAEGPSWLAAPRGSPGQGREGTAGSQFLLTRPDRSRRLPLRAKVILCDDAALYQLCSPCEMYFWTHYFIPLIRAYIFKPQTIYFNLRLYIYF